MSTADYAALAAAAVIIGLGLSMLSGIIRNARRHHQWREQCRRDVARYREAKQNAAHGHWQEPVNKTMGDKQP